MVYGNRRAEYILPWIETHDVPLLVNATERWSYPQSSFLHMWDIDTPVVIDAGGYNVQAKYLRDDATASLATELSDKSPFYPFSVEQYHEWLSENNELFDWACAMDYACEERFDDLWSVEDRMEATLQNTIRHLSLDPDYHVLPVLQGRTVDQYVEFVDRLVDHGIDVSYVGLGTVCRLSSSNKIVRVEKELRDRTPVDTIHGFGVKIDAYKRGASFETADSAAWSYASASQKMFYLSAEDGEVVTKRAHNSSGLMNTVESFKAYYTYVTMLKHGFPAAPLDERLEFSHLYETGQMDESQYLRWIDW